MPSCWFVLACLFMRIDGVVCERKEIRIQHIFGSKRIEREIKLLKGETEETMAQETHVTHSIQFD